MCLACGVKLLQSVAVHGEQSKLWVCQYVPRSVETTCERNVLDSEDPMISYAVLINLCLPIGGPGAAKSGKDAVGQNTP